MRISRVLSVSCRVLARFRYRLVSQRLEFVAGRCRPNTLRAVAFDLKAFFTVTGKDPVQVTAADAFEFLAHKRGADGGAAADRESGQSGVVALRAHRVSAISTGAPVSRLCRMAVITRTLARPSSNVDSMACPARTAVMNDRIGS